MKVSIQKIKNLITKIIYDFDEKQYEIEIIYTKNKNSYLTLKDNQIKMKVPKGFPEEYLLQFANQNIEKLVKKIENSQKLPNFVDIEAGWFYLFGKKKNFYVAKKNNRLAVIGSDFHFYISSNDKEAIASGLKRFLKKQLQNVLEDLQSELQIEMLVPKHDIMIRDKKNSWATNYVTKREIYYNSLLVHYSVPKIRYVVVHELAHHLEHGHTKLFWSIVQKYEHKWKSLRKALNARELD